MPLPGVRTISRRSRLPVLAGTVIVLVVGCASGNTAWTPGPLPSAASSAAGSPAASPDPGAAASAPAASVAPSAAASVAPSAAASVAPSAAASAAPGGSPVSSEGAVVLTVEAHDLSFRPRELDATAGHPVTLAIHNLGRIVHNLTIDELGVQLIASPGQTVSTGLADVLPGTYTFYCSVSGHRQAGMEGTLTIK